MKTALHTLYIVSLISICTLSWREVEAQEADSADVTAQPVINVEENTGLMHVMPFVNSNEQKSAQGISNDLGEEGQRAGALEVRQRPSKRDWEGACFLVCIPYRESSRDDIQQPRLALWFSPVPGTGVGKDKRIHLTIDAARKLIDFVDELERVEFAPAKDHVQYCQMDASYRGFTFRKLANGPLLMSDEWNSESFFPLDAKRLREFLQDCVQKLEDLDKNKPSVKW